MREDLAKDAGDPREVGGVNEIEHAAANDLVGEVAADACGGFVGVDDLAGGIEEGDALDAVIGEGAECLGGCGGEGAAAEGIGGEGGRA